MPSWLLHLFQLAKKLRIGGDMTNRLLWIPYKDNYTFLSICISFVFLDPDELSFALREKERGREEKVLERWVIQDGKLHVFIHSFLFSFIMCIFCSVLWSTMSDSRPNINSCLSWYRNSLVNSQTKLMLWGEFTGATLLTVSL